MGNMGGSSIQYELSMKSDKYQNSDQLAEDANISEDYSQVESQKSSSHGVSSQIKGLRDIKDLSNRDKKSSEVIENEYIEDSDDEKKETPEKTSLQETKGLSRTNQQQMLGGEHLNINDDLTYEQLGIREDNDDYIYEDDDGFDDASDNYSINEDIKVDNQREAQYHVSQNELQTTPEKGGQSPDSDQIHTNASIAQQTHLNQSNESIFSDHQIQSFVSSTKPKNKKRRIDIDDEDSIPDIRQTKRRESNKVEQPLQQAEGGARNLSGNSRPRPDDKQARHTRNSIKVQIQSQDLSKKNNLEVQKPQPPIDQINDEKVQTDRQDGNQNSHKPVVVSPEFINQETQQEEFDKMRSMSETSVKVAIGKKSETVQEFPSKQSIQNLKKNKFIGSKKAEQVQKTPIIVKKPVTYQEIIAQQKKTAQQNSQSRKKSVLNSGELTSQAPKDKTTPNQQAASNAQRKKSSSPSQIMANQLKKVKGMNSQLRENRMQNSRQKSKQRSQNINSSPVRQAKQKIAVKSKNPDPIQFQGSPRQMQDQYVIAASAPQSQINATQSSRQANPENIEDLNSPNLSSLEQNGNIINVHQHFNQPNIMNFNHNEYFDKFNKVAQNGHKVTSNKGSVDQIKRGQDVSDPNNETNVPQNNQTKRVPSEIALQNNINRVQSNKNISENRQFKREASAARRSTNELAAKRYGKGRVGTAKLDRSANIANSFQNRPHSRDGSRSSIGMNSSSMITRSFLNGAINPHQQIQRPTSRNQKSATAINISKQRKNWMNTAQDPGLIQPAFTHSGQISLADERRAFRNLRNMSAHRLESGQAFSGLDYTNGEPQLNEGYFYPHENPSKQVSTTNMVTNEEMSSLFSGNTNQIAQVGQPWAQRPSALRQSQNSEYNAMVKYKQNKVTKGRLQSAHPFTNQKSRQNNANMLIYTPALGNQQLVRPQSKGSSSQVNIGGQTGVITDSGEVNTTGVPSSLALRLSPQAILRIGQSSHKRMMDMSHQYSRKSRGNQDYLKKEDIYDSLITLKTELNRVTAENTKVKTKLAIQQDHLKNKDKFIDELLKSTYVMSQAIGMGGLGNLKRSLAQSRAIAKSALKKPNKSPRDDSAQKALDPQQMRMNKELNSSAQNYFAQNFLDKGPYNLLRMKKQVNDLKELLQLKSEEIEELSKNIRVTKCVELNEEIQIYQEECLKLRKIAEQSMIILTQNGLSSLLDKKKLLRNFKKTINPMNISVGDLQLGNERSQSPLGVFGSQADDQMAQKLMEHNNHLQREFAELSKKYDEQCQLTADALDQNSKKESQILQLNYQNEGQSLKIAELTSIVEQMRLDNKDMRDQIDKNLSVIKVKQDSDDLSIKEYKKDIQEKNTKIQELQDQINNIKEEFSQRPTPEQDGNWVYEGQKIKSMLEEETKKKELLKEKIKELQGTVDEKNECLQILETKLQESKSTANQEVQADFQNHNNALRKELDETQEKLRNERRDYLSLQETMRNVGQQNQSQLVKINELEASLKAAKEAFAAAEKKSGNDSSTKVEDLRLTAMRLSDLYQSSKASNSQLREEADRIRNILETANIEDVDERSEVVSNLKSVLKSQKSFVEGQSMIGSPVRREQRRQTNQYQKQSSVRAVEMIPEVGEHEGVGDSSSRKNTGPKPNDEEASINVSAVYVDDPAVQNINEQIAYEESKEQASKPKGLGAIGKAQSSGQIQGLQYGRTKKQKTQVRLDADAAAAVNQFKFGKQKTQKRIEDESAAASNSFGAQKSQFAAQQRLVEQLNRQIDTETLPDDALSHFVVPFPKKQATHGLATEHLIDNDDASVQLALDRIAILQQIHRVPNDEIEGILFGDKAERHRLVKLADLSRLFELKLNIQHEQAFIFARWLIEERPEDGESPMLPQYDPEQTISLGTIVIRLMVYSRYPRIYFHSHETTAKENFTTAFKGRQAKFLRAVTSLSENNQGSLITKDQFKDLVIQMSTDLTDSDIECAFVCLSRGAITFDELKSKKDNEVCEYLLGFNSKVTYKIFNDIEDESTSRNASSDYTPIETNIQFGRATTQTKINLHETKQQEVDEAQKSPEATPVTPFLGGFGANTANFVQPAKSTDRKPVTKEARRDSFAFVEMKSDSKEQSREAGGSKESEHENYASQNHLANPQSRQKQKMQPKHAFSFCNYDQQQNDSIEEGIANNKDGQQTALSAPPKLSPLLVNQNNQQIIEKQNTGATGGFQSVADESAHDDLIDQEVIKKEQEKNPFEQDSKDPADDYSDSRSDDDLDLQKSLKKEFKPDFGLSATKQQPPALAVMDYTEQELAQLRGEQAQDQLGMTTNSFVFSSQTYTDMSATQKQRGFSVTSQENQVIAPPSQVIPPPRGSLANKDISQVPKETLSMFAALAEGRSSNDESPIQSPLNEENNQFPINEENKQQQIDNQNDHQALDNIQKDALTSQTLQIGNDLNIDVSSVHDDLINQQNQVSIVDNSTEETALGKKAEQAIHSQNLATDLQISQSEQSEPEDQERRVQFKTNDSAQEQEPLQNQNQDNQSNLQRNDPQQQISERESVSQNENSMRNPQIPITSISSEAINISSPTMSQAEQSQLLQVQPSQAQDQMRQNQQTPGFQNFDESKPLEQDIQNNQIMGNEPFTAAQIENLTITLEQCLVGKIQEELRMGMNQESLQRVLDYSIDTIKRVATKMLKLNCFSVRELLQEQILVIKDNKISDQSDQPEVEVLRPLDLIDKFEKVISQPLEDEDQGLPLDNTQKQCILIVLQNDIYGDLISYNEVCKAFQDLGIPEGKPPSTPQMNYTELSLKSIRIINRLSAFINLNQLDFGQFMSDIVMKQAVKTKSSMHADIEIIQSKKFFIKLHQHGIKQSPELCYNLCEFLCIDKKYTKYLMLKKLKKCIMDFQQIKYYQSIGQRKNKPQLDEYDQIQNKAEGQRYEQITPQDQSSHIQDKQFQNSSHDLQEGGEFYSDSNSSSRHHLSQEEMDLIKSFKKGRTKSSD